MNIFLKVAAALLILLAMTGACALAQGVIVQTSCNIVPSGGGYLVHCFAQVHNAGEAVICLDEGAFQLSNNGELIVEEEISRLWPSILAPGEDGYFSDVVYLDEVEGTLAVTGLHYNVEYMEMEPIYAGQKLDASAQIEVDEEGGMTIVCRISNPTQADVYHPWIAIGLYTAAGQMVYAQGVSLADVGIPAGSAMLWQHRVDPSLTEQWRSYGATPEQAMISAIIRNQTD